MTDFHSHILPAIDDGSADIRQSLQMLRMASEQGVRRMVATPHFYPHSDDPERFLRARGEAMERLRDAMEPGMPEVIPAAEVYFYRGISDSALLRELAIGESGCVLIEMPPAPWPEEFYRELEAIRHRQGLTPIIAHIDRYIRPLRTFSIPQRLQQLPVLVQANAEFFTSRATAGMALRMLRRGQIHLLGSDCHDMDARKPNLGGAVRRIGEKLGPQRLQQLEQLEQELFGL